MTISRDRLAASASYAGCLDGLRVLVVDDEADVRNGVRKIVESTGARVSVASSGEEALEHIGKNETKLVISDIRMRGMSGVELLKAILARKPETAVVLITGYGTIAQAVECLQMGARHFLTKPFDNDELILQVIRIGRLLLAHHLRDEVVPQERRPEETGLATRDPRMRDVVALVEQASATRVPVLIQGVSGTGKELVARAIHAGSPVAAKRFLAVNCAALPDSLIESELFGYRRGAFTGAHRDQQGLFVQAQGGSVFLDEIASMSLAFQGKLLRVLQERVVRPLGASHDEKADFRLICATNRDLKEMTEQGSFREDLYYRICVVVISIPPLRDRAVDIPDLAMTLLNRAARECLAEPAACPDISDAAMEELVAHPWPGNVRELENTIQRALVTCRGPKILPHHINLRSGSRWPEMMEAQAYGEAKEQAVERFQRRFIARALERTGGNISRAAEECGLTRAAIQKIMKTLNLERNDFRERKNERKDGME